MDTSTIKIQIEDDEVEVELSLSEVLAIELPTYKRSVACDLSDCAIDNVKQNTKQISVDWVFEGWTVKDLLDRLTVSSSPRVTLQNSHRGKAVPKTWNVNKMGTKATAEPIESKIASMSETDRITALNKIAVACGYENYKAFADSMNVAR